MATSSAENEWSEQDKLSLFADILKTLPIDPEIILGIIKETKTEPNWDDVTPPEGRSLKSCQTLLENLLETSTERPQAPANPRKRGRPIKPKLAPNPASAFSFVNGEPETSLTTSSAADAAGEPPKKKRGRPSKADLEAKALAAGVPIGETSSTAKTPKPAKAGRPSLGSAAPTAVMTPPAAPVATPATTSTIKRKRGRPSKAEMEERKLMLQATAAAAGSEAVETATAAAIEQGADPDSMEEVIEAMEEQADEIAGDLDDKDVSMVETEVHASSGP
ncbi:MAG: hypothetical protein M1835_005372 [Candelina submexicana]|nr:MAG: hypothetical protein M1835_005372 [Candelina submexicana]